MNPLNTSSMALGLSKEVISPAPLTVTNVNPCNSQINPPT